MAGWGKETAAGSHGMIGLTLDTGALIALERRRPRMAKVFRTAVEMGVRVTVPSAVLVEWWRGRTDARETILAGMRVEPLDDALARLAGTALASSPKSTAIDAVVMASAARRGDIVYTADVDDLTRLQAVFPSVRVLGA
jgi:predicted nucleic acid-binding protein